VSEAGVLVPGNSRSRRRALRSAALLALLPVAPLCAAATFASLAGALACLGAAACAWGAARRNPRPWRLSWDGPALHGRRGDGRAARFEGRHSRVGRWRIGLRAPGTRVDIWRDDVGEEAFRSLAGRLRWCGRDNAG